MNGDCVNWAGVMSVEKFDEDQTAWVQSRSGLTAPKSTDFEGYHVAPYEVVESSPNLITTAGLGRLATLLIGSGQAATETATRIGVGNGDTAATIADTDLAAAAGAANRYFMTMDASYPQAAAAVVTFKATFASADGNFVWAEWCLDVGTPTVSAGATVGALMLNRKVASNGTKSSGQTWVATASVSFS